MYRFSILLIFILPTLAHAPLYDSLGLARGKLAHQYHGIHFATYGQATDTFERDGKRCILYTKRCEKYINNKLKRRVRNGKTYGARTS
jgi:hypothetical protein